MASPLRIRVPPDAANTGLASWLAARFRYFDAEQWRQQIAAGRVTRNGVPANPTEPVAAGDDVAFTPAAAEPGAPVPVLFADDDLVVVDKPPHRIVQHTTTLANAAFVPDLERAFPPVAGARLEPVHRLDRETSGVLVLARSPAAARALQQQFEAGAVHKQYLAVVHGVLAADRGAIDGAIGRARASAVAVRRAVVADDEPSARRAHTAFEVERRLAAHTVVQLTPRTGRTHQLRVHLAHLGHAIVGDKLYGANDADYFAWVAHLKATDDATTRDGVAVVRQLLHAEQLRCRHPRSGAELTFTAPRPADLLAFVARASAR